MNKVHRENNGVSVILCCYNSIERLQPTLEALAKQQKVDGIRWEVVLVDNASTDGTAAFARRVWAQLLNPTHLYLIHEARPGLGHARSKGIAAARFNTLVFCDDDNWLHPQFVFYASRIFDQQPGIVACGSLGIPVFENAPPSWFNDYAEAFATGPQDKWKENGNILSLYGAGLVIKKAVIHQLTEAGFTPVMTGRTGKQLSSSEDTELTNALVLAGKQLGYSSTLSFKHYLPAHRVNRQYLKKLFHAFGKDGPVRNMYYSAITSNWPHRHFESWTVHFLVALVRLFKYLVRPPKPDGRNIYFAWSRAYIAQLVRMRHEYKAIYKSIAGLKHALHRDNTWLTQNDAITTTDAKAVSKT